MFKYKYEYKYFKTVLEYKYKYQVYASEAITVSTTNCRRLKFLQSVIMKTYVKTRTWRGEAVQTLIENRRRKVVGNLLNDEIFTVVL